MRLIQGETLRAWRRSRGWDVPELARRLRQAAGGDPTLPTPESLRVMIHRWEREGLNASRVERYELLYAKALSISPGELSTSPVEPVSSVLPAWTSEESDDAVKRRQMLKVLGGAALTAPVGNGQDHPADDDQSVLSESLGRTQAGSPAISDLCSVLTDYGFGLSNYVSTRETRSLSELERDLEISYTAYQRSRFTAAAGRVCALLADAQIALHEGRNVERTEILRILALSYQLAASLLGKAGYRDISWIAAERGLNAAEICEMPAIRGSLIRSVAFALLSAGRFESAMRLVESGADSLGKSIVENAADLSVYGTLFLAGSIAAARFGDKGKTADYLREADESAARLGRDANYLWTAFGPTNVAIHRVNTAVELGDIQTVLDHGLSLNTGAVPEERRVRYLLDVARTHSLARNGDDSLRCLLAAERIAPEQTRQHYLTKKVITTLVKDVKGKPSIQLDRLATRAGLRVES